MAGAENSTRSAPLRPLRAGPVRAASLRSASLRFAPLRSRPVRSAGIIWSHLESFGVAWSHLDSHGLRNPGTHSRIQAFIERSCRTGALVRNRTSSLLGQLRAVNPATNITSVLWMRLPPPTPPAPSPQNSVEPPLPRKQC